MKVFEGYPLRKILKREQLLLWGLSPIVLQIVFGVLFVVHFISNNIALIKALESSTALMEYIEPEIIAGTIVGTILGAVLITIVVIWRKIPLFNRKQLSRNEWKIIPGLSKKDWIFLGWYIPVTYTLFIGGNILLSYIFGEAEAANQQTIEGMVGLAPVWALFLMIVIAAPIAEEVLFRGLILFRHNSLNASWISVVVSAFLFGLIHMPTDIPSAFSYIGMGFLFAFAAKHTRTVEAGIVYHMLNNLIAFIVLYQA